MSDYGLFWNSRGGDRVYSADSMEEWLKPFFVTGVFNGQLQVTAAGGMNVSVSPGYCNANGKIRRFDNATSFAIDIAGETTSRVDSIVVERNDGERTIDLKLIKGEIGGDATPPVRDGGIYQLVLAHINVGAGATEITTANITDTRLDADLCGYVCATVTEIDFSAITLQWDAYIEEFKREREDGYDTWVDAQELLYTQWVAAKQEAYDNWIEENESDFLAWYDRIKDILDESAAGHLQNEIDGLASEIGNLQEMITDREVGDIATRNYAVGDYLIYTSNSKALLARVILEIEVGDRIEKDTNVENITVMGTFSEVVKEIKEDMSYDVPEDITSGYALYAYDRMFNSAPVMSNTWTNYAEMFKGCVKFNQPLNLPEEIRSGMEFESMLEGCYNFNQNVELNFESHTSGLNIGSMLRATQVNPRIDFGIFENGTRINCQYMLADCKKYDQELNGFNVPEVSNFSHLFDGCRNLASSASFTLKLPKNARSSNYGEDYLSNTSYLFANSGIHPDRLEINCSRGDCTHLFDGCANLNPSNISVNVGAHNSTNKYRDEYGNFSYMFANCTNLNTPFSSINIITPSEDASIYDHIFYGSGMNQPILNAEFFSKNKASHQFANCQMFDSQCKINLITNANIYMNGSFENCRRFTQSIYINTNNSLYFAMENAFRNCTNRVVAPNVRYSGTTSTIYANNAFRDCHNLEFGINLQGIVVYASNLYRNCEMLDNDIDLSGCNRFYGDDAFRDCTNFSSNVTFNLAGFLVSANRILMNCYNFNSPILCYFQAGSTGASCNMVEALRNCVNFNSNVYISPNYLWNIDGMLRDCRNYNANFYIRSNYETSANNIFQNCESLNRNINLNMVNYAQHAFDGCTNFGGHVRADRLIYGPGTIGLFANCNNQIEKYIHLNSTQRINNYTGEDSIVGAPITWQSITNGYYNSEYNVYVYNNF